MKGTIHYCLEGTIIKNHGEKAWQNCMKAAGLPSDYTYITKIRDDIDEKESINLFVTCSKSLNIPLTELFDQFGAYWCCHYAPEIYAAFFVGIKSTKNAITKLDWVHDRVTRHIPNSNPPRFIYNWLNDDKLQLTYQSERGLIDLFISLIKGLNTCFKDTCRITKNSPTQLILEFGDDITQTELIDLTS
ncbi:MAG: heme NO-binding domain-containing protein [Cyclobacteriaceae bacterium]|nr:heme NO-binding domain-containing protein [Cyclobacteriaceae bacterium]